MSAPSAAESVSPDPHARQHCQPLRGAQHRLSDERVAELLQTLPGWTLIEGQLCKQWQFSDYDQTLAFVNGVAWMAQREDHHPDVYFGANRVRIGYFTHSVGGLSMNDFICAAKIEALRDL